MAENQTRAEHRPRRPQGQRACPAAGAAATPSPFSGSMSTPQRKQGPSQVDGAYRWLCVALGLTEQSQERWLAFSKDWMGRPRERSPRPRAGKGGGWAVGLWGPRALVGSSVGLDAEALSVEAGAQVGVGWTDGGRHRWEQTGLQLQTRPLSVLLPPLTGSLAAQEIPGSSGTCPSPV